MRAVRRMTKSSYKRALKPLMFMQHPDRVHAEIIKLARRVGKVPGVRSVPKTWAFYDDDVLAQDIAGIHFRNPVGLSAGFDKGIETPRIMRAVGFGYMTGGSVTCERYAGNEGDWFYRLPKSESLVVHAGLPSEGVTTVSQRVATYPKRIFADFPLIVSVAKTNSQKAASQNEAISDYLATLKKFAHEENVAGFEINISCPNAFGGEDFTTPERLEKLLAAIDELALTKPVFIKMPISIPDAQFDELTDVAANHQVAGLSIGNLHKNRGAVVLKDELPKHVKGNLSGAPTRDVTTALIRRTRVRHGERFILVGIGGVFTAEHAYEKIRAGATLIGMITGLIFEGPQVVGEINEGLVKLLRRDGYTHISQAIGADVDAR